MNWETTIRVVAGAIVLVAPAIMLIRQVQRASIRGTAAQLSRTKLPDLYASVDDFAATLRVKPIPTVYLGNGNGVLNAFLRPERRSARAEGRAGPDLAGRRPVRGGQHARDYYRIPVIHEPFIGRSLVVLPCDHSLAADAGDLPNAPRKRR